MVFLFLLSVLAFQFAVFFFRFGLELLLHYYDETPIEKKRKRRSFFFNACLTFYYFCVFIGSIVVCVKCANDIETFAIWAFIVIAILAFYDLGKYLYYTLRALNLHIVVFAPVYRLRGEYYAHMQALAPYEILYCDGTKDHQVLFKDKKGILWEYQGKEYLVSLYDFPFTENSVARDKLVDEEIFWNAFKDDKLQKSLIMAGGRKMESGTYYVQKNPEFFNDPMTSLYIDKTLENYDCYRHKEREPRALVRLIE